MKNYLDELKRRSKLGAAWVASQVDENGYLGDNRDMGCYYKCVIPLRLGGYSIEASRILERTMDLFYTDEGDLRNPDGRKTSGTYTSLYCQVYPNGWITLGAHLLGRFDVVRMLTKGIMDNFYDEDMGTFRSSCNPRVDLYDVNSAAMAVELLTLMDIEKAKRAADFLLKHASDQPELNRWYQSRIEKPWTYVIEQDEKKLGYTAIEIGKENQAYWFLGLPSAALALLYEMVGDERYLEGAKLYFDLFLSCGEPGFRGAGSGKSLWASSILYRLTGEKIYLESAKKLMDFFFSIQQSDGTFLMPGMKLEDVTQKFQFDTTPEYTRWFFEVAAEISAMQGLDGLQTKNRNI